MAKFCVGPRAGTVYVEMRPLLGGPREDVPDQAAALAELPAPEQATEHASTPSWGRYEGVAAVDGLLDYLNPLGRRESALKRVTNLPCLVFQGSLDMSGE